MPFTRRLPVINEPFLDEHALVAAMPGLADDGRRALFLRELEHSVQLDAYRRSFVARRGPIEPLSEGWHPWAAIATLSTDYVDEAIWLAFLTTFFGPDERRPDAWRATRVVYSAFGAESLTYTRVRDDPDLVRRLCHANDALFRSLPRGNHRKYEPRDPEHKQGLVNSVASLLTLAAAHGGLAQLLWAGTSAEARFERLMHDFRVVSFARTGRFDLLVLLGDLGVVELTPPRLYLAGATGPLEGARIVLPDIHDERELDQRLAQIATEFGISITVLEDTLCNWQKHL